MVAKIKEYYFIIGIRTAITYHPHGFMNVIYRRFSHKNGVVGKNWVFSIIMNEAHEPATSK